ncbi:MAG: oligoribonuclease [Polyangiales bacterium]
MHDDTPSTPPGQAGAAGAGETVPGNAPSGSHAGPQKERLVWLDMEMSGLCPDTCRILELAVLVTDSELQVVAEGPELVLHQDDAVLAAMDDWNQRHHGASGLIDAVRASSLSEAEAEAQVLAFVRAHCSPRSAPLAGNSVCQDRRFLARYMPRIDDFLHYRIVDVSTLKELTRRWLPAVYRGAPEKKKAHRALGDIRESIEELRYYRAHAFRR